MYRVKSLNDDRNMTFLCSKTSLGFPGGLLVPINGNKGNNMHRINWTGHLAFYFYLFCSCTLLQCLQRAIQMFLELSLKVRWAIWSYTDQFPLLPPTIIKVAASLSFSKFPIYEVSLFYTYSRMPFNQCLWLSSIAALPEDEALRSRRRCSVEHLCVL